MFTIQSADFKRRRRWWLKHEATDVLFIRTREKKKERGAGNDYYSWNQRGDEEKKIGSQSNNLQEMGEDEKS